MQCPACASELPENARFCHQCGRSTGAPGAAPPPGEPEEPAGAERRQLTVLFCDLVESSKLAAGLDPEDWRDVLRHYQRACVAVVERFEGHVAQYLGDGLLVYFGYPQAHEDEGERAVRAGLGMVEAIRERNAELQARYGLRLSLRVGIDTGPVVVGEIGSGLRRETLALGGTTNLAARLQAEAEPDAVVVSAATLRLVEGRFVTRDLGRRELRGLGPVQLHEILHPTSVRGRLEVAAAAGLTPLVGREHELRLLENCYERVRDGSGHVVLVCGEAGVGKSRLLQALRERLAKDAHAWLECHCSPYACNSPFHPVIELLAGSLSFQEGESADARLGRLEAGLEGAGCVLDEAVPLFAALLSIPLPERYPALQMSPALQRSRTLEALVAWALALGKPQPVVLVVEDLHWADPSSLEFLGLLIQRSAGARILGVLTARPDFGPPWSARELWTELPLERLTRSESARMAAALAPGRVLPPAALASIVERSDGIPLHIEELTKGVLESGLLVEREGRLEVEGEVAALAIPTTLQDSLMARLDRLSAAKSVAQVTATIGRESSYRLLAAVAESDEPTLRQGLTRLVEAELLFQSGDPPNSSYTFKHALIQDTAYESLLRSARQRLHGRIAEVLEAGELGLGAPQPELLAHHYDRADLPEKALPYYQRAGDEARARGSNLEAIAHFERGVELTRRLSEGSERWGRELALQLGLGSTLHATYGLATEATHRAWERARALCRAGGSPAQLGAALRGLTAFYDGQSDLDAAIELGEQLLELGRRTGDDSHSLAGHSALGVSRFWQGRFRECMEDFEAARRIYDRERHAPLAFVYGMDQAVEAQGFSGWALWILGFPDRARVRVDAAVRHARSLTHRYSEAYALMLASVAYMCRGEWAVCERYAEECMELSERLGFPLFRGVSGAVAALVGVTTRGEDTLAAATTGLARAAGTGQASGRPAMMWILARIHQELGREKEALELVDAALPMAAAGRQAFFDAELLRTRGELLLSRDETKAESVLLRALELACEQGALSFELRSATSLARAWRDRHREEDARGLLAPVYARFTQGFDTLDLREARRLLAELA